MQDFTIEYHFSENEWFTNKVLSMTYYVSCEVDNDDPWSFEGATIHSCQGLVFRWSGVPHFITCTYVDVRSTGRKEKI